MRLICFVFVCIPWLISAQQTPFLQNCLKYDSIRNAQVLKPFFEKMAATTIAGNKKQVRVVQIGDSHIQMGHYSGSVREQLATEFPLVGKGFWVPLTECGGYGPEGITFKQDGPWMCDKMVNSTDGNRFGITGFAYTLASGEGNITISNWNKQTITKIEIMHEINHEWKLLVDSGKVVTVNTAPNTAVTIITFKWGVKKAVLKFEGKNVSKDLRLFGFRVNNDDQAPGLDFHSYGASGGKYSDLCFNSAYVFEHLMFLKPDLLIISLGTNDAHVSNLVKSDYEQMVDRFVERIRKEFPKMVILLTSKPDTEYKGKKAPNDALVFNTEWEVASKYGCAFWDLTTAMGGLNSIRSWDKEGLADKDQMHFNKNGYRLQGKLLVWAMFESMKKLNVFVPRSGVVFD